MRAQVSIKLQIMPYYYLFKPSLKVHRDTHYMNVQNSCVLLHYKRRKLKLHTPATGTREQPGMNTQRTKMKLTLAAGCSKPLAPTN